MTGLQLHDYTRRRLGVYGVPDERLSDDPAELYDYITEGRDELLAAFALASPTAVQEAPLLLTVDGSNDRIYTIPVGSKDPYRVLVVREAETGDPLTPAAALNVDNGHYRWDTIRQLRLADHVEPDGGVEVVAVLQGDAITSASAEAGVGLPTTMHRAVGKYAAVLWLTADEESDARNAMGLYQREIERLERLYGEFDANGGAALREALMSTVGTLYGDTLY